MKDKKCQGPTYNDLGKFRTAAECYDQCVPQYSTFVFKNCSDDLCECWGMGGDCNDWKDNKDLSIYRSRKGKRIVFQIVHIVCKVYHLQYLQWKIGGLYYSTGVTEY